jgi:DNA-binding transcriptional LysR family regulator
VLQVQVDLPDPLFSHLLSNTLDVACYFRVRTPPELIVESLGVEELVIIASPEHPLAGRRRVTPQQLSEQPFVVTTTPIFRELLEAKLRAAGVNPRTIVEARNYDAIAKLVERNAGYSIHIKPLVAAELATGQLVVLNLVGPRILAEIVAAFRPSRLASPLIQEFVRFLRAELTGSEGSRGVPSQRVALRPVESPAPTTSDVHRGSRSGRMTRAHRR